MPASIIKICAKMLAFFQLKIFAAFVDSQYVTNFFCIFRVLRFLISITFLNALKLFLCFVHKTASDKKKVATCWYLRLHL